jgi:alpha-tubulin suppressor-like RCC1 family protein
MIQLDTKDIYYAPNVAAGSWTIHPIMAAANSAAAAVAAVTAMEANLGGLMSAVDYVGDGADHSVHAADTLKPATDFATANPNSATYRYVVENGVASFSPDLASFYARDLVDGVNKRTALTNTSRHCVGIGSNGVIGHNPARFVSWGYQGKLGTLGAGVNGSQSYYPRIGLFQQQPDRSVPNLVLGNLLTEGGCVKQVVMLGAATCILTTDGLVYVAGGVGQGVKPLFGSGVDKTQSQFMPIYFDDTDNAHANAHITMMDMQDSTVVANVESTGVFVDSNQGIWVVTTNPTNSPYSSGFVHDQNTPVKISDNFPSWNGKIVQKVRCDVTGNIYILFTDGTLWAGGGYNTTGQLGTGGAGAVPNLTQIRTSVTDFDVSGGAWNTTLALWTLETSTLNTYVALMGAGYNGVGQLGANDLLNKTSFVQVNPLGTSVNLVRIGGTDKVSVFFRTTLGAWYATGYNVDGTFGEGVSVANNKTPVALPTLATLIANHAGLLDLCIAGYNGNHSSCAIMNDGTVWVCGNNIDGVLGVGSVAANVLSWQTLCWAPRDVNEKIVDVSACVDPGSVPGFTWRTNQGRVLSAGSGLYGFATGTTPSTTYNQVVAAPVQFGRL